MIGSSGIESAARADRDTLFQDGFSGEDSDLFYNENTMMVFGNAKATLTALVQLLKATATASREAKAPLTPATATT